MARRQRLLAGMGASAHVWPQRMPGTRSRHSLPALARGIFALFGSAPEGVGVGDGGISVVHLSSWSGLS